MLYTSNSLNVSVCCVVVGDRARRSPRKVTTATKEEKKKKAMPKFLPLKYDVKLINEDKVCSLPAVSKRTSDLCHAVASCAVCNISDLHKTFNVHSVCF